jgi:hypothetical protein
MEIDVHNTGRVDRFLALADAKGWNWVAFDISYNGQVEVFHGFRSAHEAIEFCKNGNTEFDPYEQDLVMADYRYIAIHNLRQAMTDTSPYDTVQLSPNGLIAQLAAQGVQLPRSMNTDELLSIIRHDSVFPVKFDRLIDPETEVDRFIVVSHFHAGHDIDEVGHLVDVIDSFDTLEKAEQYFAGLIRQYHDNTDRNDYLLIGLYRDFDYRYDMEGTPENYSGLTLKHAFYQYDSDLKAKAWRVETENDISQPKNIRHFLYAQYDAQNARFKLLDDRLNETGPEEIKISTYPNHFINEKLTIKNLAIMNEQSYDYVKNQLLYMGFGEEIAQPLREKMEQGLTEFTLPHTRQFGKDQTESVLHFSKGDDQQKDLTFFNRFDMTLKQEGKEDLKQTFFVGQQYNYTLQERYNMMDGRYAYREQPKVEPKEVNGETRMVPTGETYLGWKGLNFKESDEYGNFLPKTMFWNHEKELNRYPIKELAEPYDKNRLLASMQKGNKVNVTVLKGDEEIKATVAANPRMQRFDFYDSNGQSLIVKPAEKQKLTQAENQGQVQGQQGTSGQVQQPSQGPDHADQKEQSQQADKKEGQKAEVSDEQKNNMAKTRKQGVRI